ncbi:unnamed protein product, partial [Symbiodinium microadriaticum]
MEDRTALAELVAVLTMVPPGVAPNPDAVAAHMGRLFPAVAAQAGGPTTSTTAPTSSTPGTPTMTRSASTPVFPGASPATWAGAGAAFLQPGTPNTDWARQPAGLTNEELRRNLARMEAESAAASGVQTPGVEIEIDADGRRRRVPPRGATTRPSRPTSPPRSRPTEQQPYTPMSMSAASQATDEVLNDAAIRLAMSNQNNAGHDVDMVDTPGQQTPVQPGRRSIFPPIVADNARDAGNRGRAHRRHGERPATADDPAPPAPIPDMAPLEARPVTWTPAQPMTSPLSSVPSTPQPPERTTTTASTTRTTTPRRRSQDTRDRSQTPRGASPSPGPTRRSGTVGLRSKLTNAEIGEIQRNLPEDYRRYKDRMHARGAAAEDAAPQSVRHLAKPTIEDVISTEEAADAGDAASVPKVPPMDAPTYAAYWFSRRLPEGFLGARIPWETQGRNRRVAGWCAHPCTCAGCPYVAECRELTSAGRGRCLRPIIIGNGVDHYDHHCDSERRFGDRAVGQEFAADWAVFLSRAPHGAKKKEHSAASPFAPCVVVGTRRRRRTHNSMALVPTTAPGRGTVSEFLKLVAEAGGTAHLATFARLGVVNTPAVRESFPVLLDHSVPEAVLVAILAPVPPAAPTTLVSQTPRAPVVSSSGIHDGGTRGHGARMLTGLADRGNFPLFPLLNAY